MTKSTTEELDKAQFGRVVHARPADCEPPTLRELFLANLIKAPSPDENGYLCSKSDVMKAFDSALHETWKI